MPSPKQPPRSDSVGVDYILARVPDINDRHARLRAHFAKPGFGRISRAGADEIIRNINKGDELMASLPGAAPQAKVPTSQPQERGLGRLLECLPTRGPRDATRRNMLLRFFAQAPNNEFPAEATEEFFRQITALILGQSSDRVRPAILLQQLTGSTFTEARNLIEDVIRGSTSPRR